MDCCTNRLSTWWETSSIRERVLWAAVLCAAITIIVLATAHNPSVKEPQATEDTCLTPGCVLAASRILENMDREVDPCDNFYKFACGNFIRNTNIPEDASSIDELSMLNEVVINQIRVVLEDPIKPDEPEPFVLAKKLYKACMNTSLIESRGVQPFLKILNSFGGWPVLRGDNWDESNFDWQKSVIEFRTRGFVFNHFVFVQVVNDLTDQTKLGIRIGQADLGLRRNDLVKGMENHRVIAYYNYMADIAVLLGAPKERAAAEMKETLLFEINLANMSLPIEKIIKASKVNHPYTIEELQTKYPIVNWVEYINALLPPGVTVGENDEVIVKAPSYLKDLVRLLKKTPKRVIANYLLWKTVSTHIEFLPEAFGNREVEYYKDFRGTDTFTKIQEKARWEYCAITVKQKFYYAVNALYVQKYFNADAKRNVEDIINRIKDEFIETLENVDWMDKDTKKQAVENAQAITSYVGNPEELLDVTRWGSFYKGIEIDENNYMASLLNLQTFFTNYAFSKLKEPIEEIAWTYHGDASRAKVFYSSIDRSINFPAGILQGVFFSADRPQYMNYGPIGSVIGHEIIYGFDDQVHDKDGKVLAWWSSATNEVYKKKSRCLIEQYGNYTVMEGNLIVDGVNTKDENIADNGAVREAYLAYTKWVEEHGEEPELPGLQYTPRQMFWLSAANVRCSKLSPEEMKIDVEGDIYSPDEFRIVGSFSNSEDFAKDFQCSPGSPMNPQRKCKVF